LQSERPDFLFDSPEQLLLQPNLSFFTRLSIHE
jgi:hypothetical protein